MLNIREYNLEFHTLRTSSAFTEEVAGKEK